jgi:hypothetical protein
MPPRQRLLLAYAARRRRRSSRCSALAMSSPVPHYPGVGNQVPLKERVRLGEIMDSRRAVTDPGSRLDDCPEDGFTGLLTETLIGHDRRRYLPGRQAPPCPTGRHHRCQSGCHAMARTLHPVPGPLRQLRHALLIRRRPPPCPSVALCTLRAKRSPHRGRRQDRGRALVVMHPRQPPGRGGPVRWRSLWCCLGAHVTCPAGGAPSTPLSSAHRRWMFSQMIAFTRQAAGRTASRPPAQCYFCAQPVPCRGGH